MKQLLLHFVFKLPLVYRLAILYKGNLRRKLKFLSMAKLAQRNGIADFRIERVADLYTRDWFDYKQTTKEKKTWAYSHGFSSYKLAEWYGITPENYSDFVSDFVFYSSKNYIQQKDILAWFEHKLNTYYLLSPFKESLPKHYYYIYKKSIMPLSVPSSRYGTADTIVELIQETPIAAKACYGGHGVGFYKFEYKDDFFYSNNKKITREALSNLIISLKNYIITEYVTPHPIFCDYCGEGSFAVMRIITVFDQEDGPQITTAAIRLGCKKAGITTDHEGTIYCGITLDKGMTFKPLYREADNLYTPCPKHPDTGKELEGIVIPNYAKLKDLVLSISRYLPMTPYLVMDIIPTADGFSILEINSHGQVGNVEPFYPFMKNKYNKRVFSN